MAKTLADFRGSRSESSQGVWAHISRSDLKTNFSNIPCLIQNLAQAQDFLHLILRIKCIPLCIWMLSWLREVYNQTFSGPYIKRWKGKKKKKNCTS